MKKIKEKSKIGELGRSLLKPITAVVTVFLITALLSPGAQAYDGRQEDGKLYWEQWGVAPLQLHEDYARWSVEYSDGVVDDTEHWGEIRFDTKTLSAEPINSNQGRQIIGSVRPFVYPNLPTEPSGETGMRTWPILITFVVWQDGDVNYEYDLGGFSAQYTTKEEGHEIKQQDGNAWNIEIGGTNAKAPTESSNAEAYFQNIYDYAIGKTINHDEVNLALNMIRTWYESDDEEPGWSQGNDWQAERQKVEYTEDEDTFNGRYMTFWEKIELLIPEDGYSGDPEDSSLEIAVDGFSDWPNSAHAIDYDATDCEWNIEITVTDVLEDGSSGGGGGGGGGTDPIPTGSDPFGGD